MLLYWNILLSSAFLFLHLFIFCDGWGKYSQTWEYHVRFTVMGKGLAVLFKNKNKRRNKRHPHTSRRTLSHSYSHFIPVNTRVCVCSHTHYLWQLHDECIARNRFNVFTLFFPCQTSKRGHLASAYESVAQTDYNLNLEAKKCHKHIFTKKKKNFELFYRLI